MDDLSNSAPSEQQSDSDHGQAPDQSAANEAAKQEAKVLAERDAEAKSEAKLDNDLRRIMREAKRDRAEDGKFAGKEGADKDKDAAKTLEQPAKKPAEKVAQKDGKPEAAKATEKAPEQVEQKVETAKPTHKIEAPAHWSDSVKAKFASLPEDVAKEISDMGLRDRQTLSKQGNLLQQFQPVQKVLEEFKEVFDANGVTYDVGMRQLLEAQKLLDTNPMLGFQKLAKAFNVDLYDLVANAEGNDPRTSELETKLANTEKQLRALSEKLEARDRYETERHQSKSVALVQQFFADKPDAKELEPQILGMIPAIRDRNPTASPETILQQAYDAARWADPKTRQQMVEAEVKGVEQKRSEAARKAADDAQRANSINVSGSPAQSDPDDWKSEMKGIYRKHRSAA